MFMMLKRDIKGGALLRLLTASQRLQLGCCSLAVPHPLVHEICYI